MKDRLNGYYVNGLLVTPHAFMSSILVCVGLEVLGQIMLGYNEKGESIESHTMAVYHLMDQQLAEVLTPLFKTTYNKNRNHDQQSRDFTPVLITYGHVVRKGLRNAFTHNYRSLEVFLGNINGDMIAVDEQHGWVVIDPEIFKQRFIELYN